MARIRTGVVGCGYLGRHHARILTELAGSEPVGFVEPDDDAASAIEAAHGSKGLVRRRSVKELLGAGATAVVVASPTSTHADVAEELLTGGADVMVEKPVTEIRAVGVPILSEKIDIASVRLSFEGGCVANLTASRVSQDKTRKFRFFQPDWYFSIDTQNRD